MYEIRESLPERAQAKVDALMGEIEAGLFDEFAVAGGGNKIMRPLAAYRRLLSFLLHLRFVRHEKGDGFILKGHGEGEMGWKPAIFTFVIRYSNSLLRSSLAQNSTRRSLNAPSPWISR